jgi:hypothetical protein
MAESSIKMDEKIIMRINEVLLEMFKVENTEILSLAL